MAGVQLVLQALWGLEQRAGAVCQNVGHIHLYKLDSTQLKGSEGGYVQLRTIISCAKGPFTRLASGLMHNIDLHLKSITDSVMEGWFYEVVR